MNPTGDMPTTTPAEPGERRVPEKLLLYFEPPLQPRRVGLLLGIAGLWLFPKRVGPHLAEAPWPKAVAANIFGTLGMALLALALNLDRLQMMSDFPGLGVFTTIRAMLAEVILFFAQGGSLAPFAFVPGAVLAFEAAVFVIAVGLIAWIPAGDPPRKILARAVKLALWLSTVSIPVAAWYLLVDLASREWTDTAEEWAKQGAVLFCAVYILWLTLRGGLRYAGPTEGPGFEPLPPSCAECGYNLCWLERGGRCPECGLRVAESITPGGRGPSVFAAARGPAAKIVAYWKLLPRLMRRPRPFYAGLAAKREHAAARVFALMTWAQLSLMVLLLLYGYGMVEERYELPYDAADHTRLVLLVTIPVLALVWGMAFASVIGCWRILRGVDTRSVACATFYATACAWPLALFTALAICGLHQLNCFLVGVSWRIGLAGFHLGIEDLATWICGLVMAGLLLFWTLRTMQAVGHTRYSNF